MSKDPYITKGKDGVVRTLYNCQQCHGTFLAPVIEGKGYLCYSCKEARNREKNQEFDKYPRLGNANLKYED